MKQQLTLVLFLLSTLFLLAQKDKRLIRNLNAIEAVPLLIMPSQNNEALLAAETQRRAPGVAPKYAVNLEVNITPSTHGVWETVGDDRMVWRLRIKSVKAYSINLGFSQYNMPRGGKFFLYTPDYNRVIGPFTPADNEEHEQLWTPIISGDEIVLELQLPIQEMDNFDLELSYVNHAFQNFGALISGSCNLDVICGGADGWSIIDEHRDIIQSVAVISTGGGTFCTGFLVNNVLEDCTPFFMTANHCGINPTNAPSLVTYWNFVNSTCRQPNSPDSGDEGDGQLNDFNTGAIFRAARSNSDFTLVELDDPVSSTANAYFAGWDASASNISNAIGIHHPSTDEKRISLDVDPLQFTAYYGNSTINNFDHVRVIDWNIGTTEPGSSGSPLFDQNDRVVGQLHGGDAACGNNQSDWYGAFATSWDAGGSSTSRLKDWLDPSNSGALVINGRYANNCVFSVVSTPSSQTICPPVSTIYSLAISDAFSATVSLTANGLPAGASASFSPSSVIPGGVSTLSITTAGVAAGTYTITIQATSGGENAQTEITLVVLDGSFEVPILISPLNNSQSIFPNPLLNWDGDDSGITTYEIQIAANSSFSTILESGQSTSTFYQSTNTGNGLTTYYWRVRSTNTCGTSAYASAFNFTTQNVNCITYTSNSSSLISEVGTPTVENNIFIGDNNIILEVSVHLDVTHNYIGDLDAVLFPPSGASLLLFDRPGQPNDLFGCSQDNLFLFFNANSLNSASDLENTCNDSETGLNNPGPPYAIEGSFQALGNLSSLTNQNSFGLWTLELNDNLAADGGVLEVWNIIVCYAIESSPPVVITNNVLEVPRGADEIITQAHLEVESEGNTSSQLEYSITNLPTQGTLKRNGVTLNIGATFTQSDINNGLLAYFHNGGIVLNDQFEFAVTNNEGLSLAGNLFFIEITLSPMNVSLQLTNTIACNGDLTAGLTVIVSGGLPPYDYALNGMSYQASNAFMGLGAGNYVVTVLDDLGATVDSPVFVISEPTALNGSVSVNFDVITVMATGGTFPYLYNINGGPNQGSPIFLDLENNDYTIIIADAFGCMYTLNATVFVNPLEIQGALVADITCHDANDGIVTVLANGGTPPYLYSLNGGPFGGNNLFQNLATGSYQITVRDAAGLLSTTNSILVSNPTLLIATNTVEETTIMVSAFGGTPPYMYSLNGGANTQTSSIFTSLQNGNYTVTVLDTNGCITTNMATIAVNTLVVDINMINNISCHNADDGSFCVVASGGLLSYEYKLNEESYQDDNCFTNLSGGTYVVVIKDAEGFTRTITGILMTNPPLLTINAGVIENTISLEAEGGTPPLLFSINGGEALQESPVFINNSNGNYEVSVMDVYGCIATTSITVAFNTLVVSTVIISGVNCYNVNDGSVMIAVTGGIPPYEYSLDGVFYQEENVFDNLSAGDYEFWVKDAEGFTRMTDLILFSNPLEMIMNATVMVDTITITVSGGTGDLVYSINGIDFQAENQFPDLMDGVYQATVRDENGCAITQEVIIAVSSMQVGLQLTASISCLNANDAIISANALGGIAPYEYSLDGENYQNGPSFSNLGEGLYFITVKDAVGTIVVSLEIEINNPPLLTLALNVVNNTIFASGTGGVGVYQYSLDGIIFTTTSQFTDLENGDYQVWVQDQNGCLANEMESILVRIVDVFIPELSLDIFPNPTQGQFQLLIGQKTGRILNCSIYNVAGQIVLQQVFEKTLDVFQMRFDLRNYPSGVYGIVISDGNLVGIKRMIVQE